MACQPSSPPDQGVGLDGASAPKPNVDAALTDGSNSTGDRYLPPLLDRGLQPRDGGPVLDGTALQDGRPSSDAQPITLDANGSSMDSNQLGPNDIGSRDAHVLTDILVVPDTAPSDAMAPPLDLRSPDAQVGVDATPVAVCGNGIVENGEDCDDGNQIEFDRCTRQCRWYDPCVAPEADCRERDDWVANLREHHMVAAPSCSFTLRAPTQEEWTESHRLVEQLGAAIGNTQGIDEVLGNLNRMGTNAVTNQTALRLRNHNFSGFVWNDGDMDVSYWYPQGITGTSDAYGAANHNGRRLMMVSWYHRTDNRPTKGARISLVDLTNLNDIRYRHLLLVKPITTVNGVNFRAVRYDHGDQDALHAGGIVWLGPYLYVADTRVGMRVFDLTRMMRMSSTDDTGAIGLAGNRSDGHGYAYVIPQVARYALTDTSCPLSFSAISLDRSTQPPTILSSEYRSGDPQGRLIHWPVDLENHRLLDLHGLVDGRQIKMSAQTRVQGALTWEGNYYISSSSQFNRFGRLYRTRPGMESSISAWIYGCEDLYYERSTGLIWTPGEFPDFRDVVGIPLRTP